MDELNIIICSDDFLLEINKKFLQHNYFTDVITFSYLEEVVKSAEIYLSIDRIRENAKEYGIGTYKEFLRIIVHGVLHAAGHEDSKKAEKQKMTILENVYLKKFDHF